MKHILLILCAVLISGLSNKISAQDTIYKADRSMIIAKVTEVGTYDIKYRRYSSPDGPVYIIHKTDVWKIVYSDGMTEYYNRRNENSNPVKDPNFVQRPLSVSLNIFDVMFTMVTVTTEYNFANSNTSVRIPLSFGLQPSNQSSSLSDGYYYNPQKVYSTGIDLIFFPLGKEKGSNYYIGFASEFGMTKQTRYNSWPNTYTTYNQSFGGGGIINGFQTYIADRITIGIDVTIGTQYSEANYRPMGRLGVLMGWRFGKIKPEIKISN